MSKLKPMLMLLACSLLAACQTSALLSKTPSAPPTKLPAQTDQVKVTISCGEHEPDPALPDYPEPSQPLDWQAWSKAQALWGASAIGAFRTEKTLRHSTAACLDQLRAKGLIN